MENILFRSFLYTYDEYVWMTRFDVEKEPHNILEPINGDEDLRNLKLRLILLRKYTSPENRGEEIYILKLLRNMLKSFPHRINEVQVIISKIDDIENNMMSSSLSNGETLSLRDTIELELYGIHLHSDIKKIERLALSDPQLRYIAIREYVTAYEVALQETYKILKLEGEEPIPSEKEKKANILRMTKTEGVEQGVAKSVYWSNVFGRDATDEELKANLLSKDEETLYIFIMANILLDYLEQDVIDTNALRNIIHPSVINDWGDFSEAGEYVKSFKDIGLSENVRFNARHDMAYVYLLENVVDGFVIQDYQIIGNAHVITFAKGSEGDWFVYGVGAKIEEYLMPIKPIDSLKKLIGSLKDRIGFR